MADSKAKRMQRKRRRTPAVLQPPELPTPLSVAALKRLADQLHCTCCSISDHGFDTQVAEDILLDRVLCKHSSFQHTQLNLAQLMDVRLEVCDMAAATWTKASLHRIELIGCRASGMAMLDSELQDVLIQRCTAELMRIWSSRLQRVRFEQCRLQKSSFEQSNLRGVVFRHCDLSGAQFSGARMQGCDLRGSQLQGITVGIQELQGAIIDPGQALLLASLLGLLVQPEEPD